MAESTSQLDPVVAGANAATRVNESFDAASPGMFYGRRAQTSSGLTWGFFGGRFGSALIANGSVTLTASATNHVVASRTTGVVTTTTAATNWNDTVGFLRLYIVTTGAVNASSWQDHRQAFGAAGASGGGLVDYVEARASTGVNTPTTVVSLRNNDAATNSDVALVPKGLGAFLAAIPDGATAGGNKRGDRAVDLQTRRGAATQVASGVESAILGGYNHTASGDQSVVSGGRDNQNAGLLAGMLAGFSNTAASGATAAAVVGGSGHSLSAPRSFVGGGTGATIGASADHAAVLGGSNQSVTAANGAILAGANNTVDAENGVASGNNALTRSLRSSRALAGSRFAVDGDAQMREGCVRQTTTNATQADLTVTGIAASTTQTPVLSNGSCMAFDLLISARENATGDAAAYRITGLIKRGASAATTALVGSATITTLANDAGASGWAVAVAADTTNGGLLVRATGEAAKTIRWVAHLRMVEVAG